MNKETKKEKSNIHIVNMASTSYTAPKISESINKKWVDYGENNDYFQYLIDRYNGSPTNNAAINGIAEMIYGRGLEVVGEEDEVISEAIKVLLPKKEVKRVCYDFKMAGQGALQVIYTKGGQVDSCKHVPIETLRAEKSNLGEIKGYYYHPTWNSSDIIKSKPKRYPAFGFGNKKETEILYIKPYRAGYFYYAPVGYQGGLQYAELEEEVANYHLNNIKNGLAPSMLINFNNGVPDDTERRAIEKDIKEKFGGSSNAGRFILAFNDSKELSASIEPVILSDASEQYRFLSEESMRKIMVSHRIVSGMLIGIKENVGFGNNAEELQTASTLMDNTVIRPDQQTLLDAFEEVLEVNGIDKELYFKTLQPLEFTDLTNAMTDEVVEQETGVKGQSNEEEITKVEEV